MESEVPLDYFYDKLTGPGYPTSSQPSQGEIQAVFGRLLAAGHDIWLFSLVQDQWYYETALGAKEAILKNARRLKSRLSTP